MQNGQEEKAEEIVAKLRQVKVMTAQGANRSLKRSVR